MLPTFNKAYETSWDTDLPPAIFGSTTGTRNPIWRLRVSYPIPVRRWCRWSGWRASNSQLSAWKADTLPIELQPHNYWKVVSELHRSKWLCRPLHKLLCQRLIGGVREIRTPKTFPFYSFRNCYNCHSAITPLAESLRFELRELKNSSLVLQTSAFTNSANSRWRKDWVTLPTLLFKEHFA